MILLGARWQQRLSDNELGEDAADGPNINCAGVFLPGENDLRSPVPSCGNIVGQYRVGRLQLLNVGSSQTEVANFEITVRIDQQVAGLEIPVVNAGRMDVFESTENLVQEELNVVVR